MLRSKNTSHSDPARLHKKLLGPAPLLGLGLLPVGLQKKNSLRSRFGAGSHRVWEVVFWVPKNQLSSNWWFGWVVRFGSVLFSLKNLGFKPPKPIQASN